MALRPITLPVLVCLGPCPVCSVCVLCAVCWGVTFLAARYRLLAWRCRLKAFHLYHTRPHDAPLLELAVANYLTGLVCSPVLELQWSNQPRLATLLMGFRHKDHLSTKRTKINQTIRGCKHQTLQSIGHPSSGFAVCSIRRIRLETVSCSHQTPAPFGLAPTHSQLMAHCSRFLLVGG